MATSAEDEVLMDEDEYAYKDIIDHQVNKFKGRAFNLIESSISTDKKQEATKELLRDFMNDLHRDLQISIRDYAEKQGIIDEEDAESLPPVPNKH